MPRSITDAQFNEFAEHKHGDSSLALAWGASSGAVIGTGISLTMGLFSTAQFLSVFVLIALSAAVGAFFAYALFMLLSETSAFSPSADRNAPVEYTGPLMGNEPIYDHKALKADKETKILSNQDIMQRLHAMRSGNAAGLAPYRKNAQIFDMIVAGAQTSESDSRR